MSKAAAVGLLSGFGQGFEKVGTMMAQADMQALRDERLNKLQGQRDEKLFAQKQNLQNDSQEHSKGLLTQKNKFTSGENVKGRQHEKDMTDLKAAADAAKSATTPTAKQRAFEEYKSIFTRLNPDRKMTPEVEITLANSIFGTSENVKTDYGFSRVEPSTTGAPEVSLEVGRGANQSRREARQSPQVIGGRGGMPLKDTPKPTTTPPLDPNKYGQIKGDYSMYKDGQYKREDGTVITIVNGAAYRLK